MKEKKYVSIKVTIIRILIFAGVLQYSSWGLYGSAPINPKIDIVQNIAKFICG